jgi:hypothetical protein
MFEHTGTREAVLALPSQLARWKNMLPKAHPAMVDYLQQVQQNLGPPYPGQVVNWFPLKKAGVFHRALRFLGKV